MNKKELEDRLINFAVNTINMTESISHSYAGNHLANQLIRSSSSPALNYAEAQGAESKKDFLHKIKIALKELRESLFCIKIIKNLNLTPENQIQPIEKECNELVSIFVKSAETTQKSMP